MCLHVYVSVCVSAPSKPDGLVYVDSTENSLTLSWKQSGAVDNYIIEYNDTVTTSVSVTGDFNVSATVSLPKSGTYYCIIVTAVSGHLRSRSVPLCNYTGEWLLWVFRSISRYQYFEVFGLSI